MFFCTCHCTRSTSMSCPCGAPPIPFPSLLGSLSMSAANPTPAALLIPSLHTAACWRSRKPARNAHIAASSPQSIYQSYQSLMSSASSRSLVSLCLCIAHDVMVVSRDLTLVRRPVYYIYPYPYPVLQAHLGLFSGDSLIPLVLGDERGFEVSRSQVTVEVATLLTSLVGSSRS